MNTELFYGSPGTKNFDLIIDMASDNDFNRLTCSTVPLYNYWKEYKKRLSFLKKNLMISNSKDFKIFFEFPVESLKKAKASFTDLMIELDDCAIAVEGKYTEKRYPTCGEWLKQKHPITVLQHWLDLINNFCGTALVPNAVNDIVYQLVHRTASACSMRKKYCFVGYQVFYDQKTHHTHYSKDIQDFKNIVGFNSKINFFIHEVEIAANKNYKNLEIRLKKLSFDKAMHTKSAMKYSDLFDFKREEINII